MVARVVAQPVVDLLEPVEVAEQQRQLARGRQCARDRLLQPFVERAPVRQPGERILIGERLQAREQLGAPDRRRHLGAQRFREANVRDRERRRSDGRVRLEHAPHAIAEADRAASADPRPILLEELALLVREPHVLKRDHVRLGALDQHPVERGELPGLQRRALLLAGIQLTGVGERAHPSCSGSQRLIEMPAARSTLARLVADRVEHLLEPVRAGHGARDGDQRAQLGLQRPVGPHAAGAAGPPRSRRGRSRSPALRRGRVRASALPPWSGRTACRCGARAPRAPGRASARGGTGGRTSSRATRRRRSRCGSRAGRPRRRARPGSRRRPSARAPRAPPARGGRASRSRSTICAPIAGCSRITSHSGAVSRPCFCRIASGTPTLPMSCSSATCPTEVALSESIPSSAATSSASSSTASECAAV